MLLPDDKQSTSSAGKVASKKGSAPPVSTSEPLSAREQAETYRLVTAIFPIDVLTPVWKQGTNRLLNIPHRQRLCQAFRRELHRTDPNNALRLVCTRSEVDRMTSELEHQGESRTDWRQRTPDAWPSFLDWQRVNPEPVEVMAGQHRVEALKEYSKDQKDAKGEGWWLCDVYDRGGSKLRRILLARGFTLNFTPQKPSHSSFRFNFEPTVRT